MALYHTCIIICAIINMCHIHQFHGIIREIINTHRDFNETRISKHLNQRMRLITISKSAIVDISTGEGNIRSIIILIDNQLSRIIISIR